MDSGKKVEIQIDRMAAGGDGIGNDDSGRVVFVPATLPGDIVLASLVQEKKKFARGRVVEVITAGAGRQEPPCPHVTAGCGGCDWQHANPATQTEMRLAIVRDSLRRLGRLEPERVTEVVHAGPALKPDGYRTTVRILISNGKAGFRKAQSHDMVEVGDCLVAHPMIQTIMAETDFGNATEATIKVGAITGEQMVVVSPDANGVRAPEGVTVVGTDQLDAGATAYYHEQIGSKTFRVSAQSFFQCRPDGAQALAELVATAIAGIDGPMLDAYCGVGLFAGLVAGDRPVTGVEVNSHAVADAEYNVAHGEFITAATKDWVADKQYPVVVADPARVGLGAADLVALVAAEPQVLALVSCDPAALGRDAGLLAEHGYELERCDVVDMFAQTSHIECVSKFVRL